jgi:hypothetical protein
MAFRRLAFSCCSCCNMATMSCIWMLEASPILVVDSRQTVADGNSHKTRNNTRSSKTRSSNNGSNIDLEEQVQLVLTRVRDNVLRFSIYTARTLLGNSKVGNLAPPPSREKFASSLLLSRPWHLGKSPHHLPVGKSPHRHCYCQVRDTSCQTPLRPSVGVKPNTWKSWGIGVLRDSRMFRPQQQGPKHLALGCFWCHWKGLET